MNHLQIQAETIFTAIRRDPTASLQRNANIISIVMLAADRIIQERVKDAYTAQFPASYLPDISLDIYAENSIRSQSYCKIISQWNSNDSLVGTQSQLVKWLRFKDQLVQIESCILEQEKVFELISQAIEVARLATTNACRKEIGEFFDGHAGAMAQMSFMKQKGVRNWYPALLDASLVGLRDSRYNPEEPVLTNSFRTVNEVCRELTLMSTCKIAVKTYTYQGSSGVEWVPNQLTVQRRPKLSLAHPTAVKMQPYGTPSNEGPVMMPVQLLAFKRQQTLNLYRYIMHYQIVQYTLQQTNLFKDFAQVGLNVEALYLENVQTKSTFVQRLTTIVEPMLAQQQADDPNHVPPKHKPKPVKAEPRTFKQEPQGKIHSLISVVPAYDNDDSGYFVVSQPSEYSKIFHQHVSDAWYQRFSQSNQSAFDHVEEPSESEGYQQSIPSVSVPKQPVVVQKQVPRRAEPEENKHVPAGTSYKLPEQAPLLSIPLIKLQFQGQSMFGQPQVSNMPPKMVNQTAQMDDVGIKNTEPSVSQNVQSNQRVSSNIPQASNSMPQSLKDLFNRARHPIPNVRTEQIPVFTTSSPETKPYKGASQPVLEDYPDSVNVSSDISQRSQPTNKMPPTPREPILSDYDEDLNLNADDSPRIVDHNLHSQRESKSNISHKFSRKQIFSMSDNQISEDLNRDFDSYQDGTSEDADGDSYGYKEVPVAEGFIGKRAIVDNESDTEVAVPLWQKMSVSFNSESKGVDAPKLQKNDTNLQSELADDNAPKLQKIYTDLQTELDADNATNLQKMYESQNSVPPNMDASSEQISDTQYSFTPSMLTTTIKPRQPGMNDRVSTLTAADKQLVKVLSQNVIEESKTEVVSLTKRMREPSVLHRDYEDQSIKSKPRKNTPQTASIGDILHHRQAHVPIRGADNLLEQTKQYLFAQIYSIPDSVIHLPYLEVIPLSLYVQDQNISINGLQVERRLYLSDADSSVLTPAPYKIKQNYIASASMVSTQTMLNEYLSDLGTNMVDAVFCCTQLQKDMIKQVVITVRAFLRLSIQQSRGQYDSITVVPDEIAKFLRDSSRIVIQSSVKDIIGPITFATTDLTIATKRAIDREVFDYNFSQSSHFGQVFILQRIARSIHTEGLQTQSLTGQTVLTNIPALARHIVGMLCTQVGVAHVHDNVNRDTLRWHPKYGMGLYMIHFGKWFLNWYLQNTLNPFDHEQLFYWHTYPTHSLCAATQHLYQAWQECAARQFAARDAFGFDSSLPKSDEDNSKPFYIEGTYMPLTYMEMFAVSHVLCPTFSSNVFTFEILSGVVEYNNDLYLIKETKKTNELNMQDDMDPEIKSVSTAVMRAFYMRQGLSTMKSSTFMDNKITSLLVQVVPKFTLKHEPMLMQKLLVVLYYQAKSELFEYKRVSGEASFNNGLMRRAYALQQRLWPALKDFYENNETVLHASSYPNMI